MDILEEEKETVLSTTYSVCPECLQRIPAQRVAKGESVFLKKKCPEHGEYQVRIWQGEPNYQVWNEFQMSALSKDSREQSPDRCPFDCGLCSKHRQQTCCVLLEVTKRCNLRCPVCFAKAGDDGEDPGLSEIETWFEMLMECGGPYNIQLSGGEPTIRNDLPEIIGMGKKLGFTFFQVNTNGLRLAADEEYVRQLKTAGLNCVFLQFDGLSDDVYTKLRGRPLLAIKKKVVDVCRRYDLGVVLVPTLVPGVNDEQVGEIIEFAVRNMPTVRGVHFQPISYFGRYPKDPGDEDRITIPQLLRKIERQTKGQMKAGDFYPPGAEHASCSFHGNFLLLPNGELQAFQRTNTACCQNKSQDDGGAKRARQFVARQWSAARKAAVQNKETNIPAMEGDLSSLDAFLVRVNTHTLAISGMAFQDAWTLDVERLKQCFIHVVSPDKKLIPFCAYNLTDKQGRSLYRGG